MPGRSQPPTARLRRLAAELLRLRKGADLTREDVAEHTGINQATLYRIEMAKARPQARTLKALTALYEVDAVKRDELTALLREANKKGWLQPYHEDLSEQYNALIGFEAEAQVIWTCSLTIVPGLLQAEGYARSLIKGMLPEATDEEVERRVAARISRQEVLTKENPLRLWAVVDEAALHRHVGTVEEVRHQVEHLREVARRPEVTLQVLKYDAGAHPAMLGAFDILKFGEAAAPDIVYLEGLTNDLFLDDESSINRYTATFEHLRASAASATATDKFLAQVAREI
jgi:transcriptional regulator with XRE-family HTH domain